MSYQQTAAALVAVLLLGGCAEASVKDAGDCASCATASGRFVTQAYEVRSTSGNWFAADLDLDGSDELIVTRPAELTHVYSLDERGRLEEAASLPPATWATVGDVTNDGRPDVLLGGTSFVALRSTEQGGFAPLTGSSTPVSGEKSGRVSVTKFPIVGRWHSPDNREPLIVKGVYHVDERSLLPSQVEAFSSGAGNVSSGGNAPLTMLLRVAKRFVAIDLDGDGLDELWGIDLFGQLTRMSPGAGAAGASWQVNGTWPVDDSEQIGVRDVNGDGAPDLVSLYGALVVTGAGAGVGAGRVHELALPSVGATCAWLQLDRDVERELLCGSDADGGLTAYDADFETDELVQRDALEIAGGASFVAGDFDGNGVDDLAVLGEQLHIAFGVAAR